MLAPFKCTEVDSVYLYLKTFYPGGKIVIPRRVSPGAVTLPCKQPSSTIPLIGTFSTLEGPTMC